MLLDKSYLHHISRCRYPTHLLFQWSF